MRCYRVTSAVVYLLPEKQGFLKKIAKFYKNAVKNWIQGILLKKIGLLTPKKRGVGVKWSMGWGALTMEKTSLEV